MASASNKRTLTIIVHIAAWVCFLLVPIIFQPHPRFLPSSISNHFQAVLISSSIYLILFYYINTQLLIPKLLLTKSWTWYIFSVFIFFFIFIYLPEWLASLVTEPISEADYKLAEIQRFKRHFTDSLPNVDHKASFISGRRRFHFFTNSYLIFILVFAIGTCIAVIQQWLQIEQTKKEIEREKLNTELLFLKSQINPHFFFNTLNNIYSLAVTGSEKTAGTILQLSAIMRYVISDAQLDFVSLEDELTFVKHYIDLQLVRLTDNVSVTFTQEGEMGNKMIAPLLFISFVENAFKYGVSTREDTAISFHLKATDKRILFSASNKVIITENNNKETTGIGINNVKRRLELVYPNKHHLQIFNTDQTYSIQLEITIT